MSIQNEINRITNNVADAYAAVEEKGGSVPEEANSDNLAEAINTIPELEGVPVKPITEAEYNALSDEEKNGETAWLVTDAEGSGSEAGAGSSSDSGEVYSLEEVRIGTWIDDKPFYRIVKQGTLPSTTNAWNKIVEIPNMDRLLFAQISVYVNVSSVKYTLYDHTTGVGQLDQWVVFYNPSSGSYSSKEYLLTIKYTKTTD